MEPSTCLSEASVQKPSIWNRLHVSRRPQYRSPPSRFPSCSPCRERERDAPFLKAFLDMFLGVPSKRAPPSGSPYRVCIYREVLHFQSLPLHIFHSPQPKRPPSRFPLQSSHRDAPLPEPSFTRQSPPLQLPLVFPYGERCPFPEPSFTYLSEVSVKEPSLQIPLTELP